MSKISVLSTAAVLLPTALAAFNANSSSNVVVYWGQNSAGGMHTQQRLSHFCEKAEANVIPISFLTSLIDPTLDLASAGGQCSPIHGTKLMFCPQMRDDIKECQTNYNKTILLSLGGATYNEGGFENDNDARATAQKLWNLFGPPGISSIFGPTRPFGSAIIDGFDLDFEEIVHHMPTFANELRRLMDKSKNSRGQKYLLTAAPQCVFPDAANDEMLNGAVSFDAIFVQFYNNYCGVGGFKKDGKSQRSFNFGVWDEWARKVSKNKNVKVMLGVPAHREAAGSGYVAPKELEAIVQYTRNYKNFGGVMMWDASQMERNKGFLSSVAEILGVLPEEPISSIVSPKPKVENPPIVNGATRGFRAIVEMKKNFMASLREKVKNFKSGNRYKKSYQAGDLAARPPNAATAVITTVNITKPERTPGSWRGAWFAKDQ